MGIRRSIRFAIGLALLLPLLAISGPAVAQRTTPAAAAAAAASGLGRAYVTDPFASTVTVIDTATFEIVTVIPVGFLAFDATLSPDESLLYVTSEASIYVIDTATNTVTTTIPVGDSPQGIAFTPDGSRAYVTNGGSSTVSVIDTATNTVIATIPIEGAFPGEVAISPDGSRAYVVVTGSETVAVIDTATNTVIATIPVGVQPIAVAVSPNGTRAYVSNDGSASVSVINTATNTVIATIPVGDNPRGLDVSPEGTQVYVADGSTNGLQVIDVASNTVTKTLPTDIGAPINVEVTARRVYVVGISGQLSVIDRVVEAVVAVVSIAPDPENPFGANGWGLAVSEGAPPAGNPTITTQASPSNIGRTFFSDTATVTGGVNPTGVVIFRLYRDVSCAEEVTTPITRPLVNGTATAEAYLDVPGTYYWRALYTGDANNNPATHPCNAPNESVVVRPFAPPPFTETITGDFVGPVVVDAGESVQIVNARVVGPITVNPGGSLVIVNSQISGGIIATSPGFLRICGSQVAGRGQALAVFDAVVPIVIGDPSDGCAGNRFAGNVNLISNYGLTFNNNLVSANLTVNDGGPANTQLRSNTIFGNLACSGNDPFDATRPLNRNTVNGTRSGQCVAPF